MLFRVGNANAAGEIEDYSEPILPGDGASDYERYLRTDELLALQKTPAEQAHRDELLFQTVHQSSELWLKHAAVEVEEATAVVEREDLAGALRLLRRSALGLRLIIDQLTCSSRCRPGSTRKSVRCSATEAASTRLAFAGCGRQSRPSASPSQRSCESAA